MIFMGDTIVRCNSRGVTLNMLRVVSSNKRNPFGNQNAYKISTLRVVNFESRDPTLPSCRISNDHEARKGLQKVKFLNKRAIQLFMFLGFFEILMPQVWPFASVYPEDTSLTFTKINHARHFRDGCACFRHAPVWLG